MDIHNKGDSNLKEPSTNAEENTFPIKISSPPREDNEIFWKVLKVGCVHGLSSTAFTLGSRNPCYSTVYTNFFFSHMSLNSVIHYFMHENSVSYSSIIFQHYFSLVSDKNNLSNWREIFWVFDRQIQRNQPEF